MTKAKINYSNTIIYKIACRNENIKEIHVGHTTDFIKRKNQHKTRLQQSNLLEIYEIIRDNGGWNNWKMVEIVKYPCNTKQEAEEQVKLLYNKIKQVSEKELSPLEPINPIDLIVWTNKMVYICVDIRDVMGKHVCNLSNPNIFY